MGTLLLNGIAGKASVSGVRYFTVNGTTQMVYVGPPLAFPGLPSDMQLAIVDPDNIAENAPTDVGVSISSAPPNAVVSFTIDTDDTVVKTVTVNSGGNADLVAVPIADTYGAGTHTIHATADDALEATVDFTLDDDPTPLPDAPDTDVPPSDSTTTRWKFEDPVTGGLGTWTFTASPVSADPIPNERSLNVAPTTGGYDRDSRYHVYEARQMPDQWSFKGTVWNQADYARLRGFANLNRKFYLFDDLGRTWVITISKLSMVPRKRQAFAQSGDPTTQRDWIHDYIVTAYIYKQVT